MPVTFVHDDSIVKTDQSNAYGRDRLPEVAEQFPIWGPMVEAWDELTALYEGCCEPNGQYTRASYEANEATASKLYARMQVLIDEGRIAAGWTKTGPGCWQGPGVRVVSLGARTQG